MAKEIAIQVKFNGQELDAAKLSMNELGVLTSQLKQKLSEVPIGSQEFKKVSADIESLEAGFKKAQDTTKSFGDKFAELPGVMGVVGESVKGVKGAFDLLAENPLIAAFTLLAAVIAPIIEKFKEMQGVMEPLEEIGAQFSQIFGDIATLVVKPLAEGLELLADGAAKVGNFFSSLTGGASKAGDALAETKKSQEELARTSGLFAAEQAKANAELAEARERANDANLPIKDRIQALKDAASKEREITEEKKKRDLEAARDAAVQAAIKLKQTDAQIEALKKGSAEELKAFATANAHAKELNAEIINGIANSVGAVSEADRSLALIEKKTNAQIKAKEKEQQAKDKEAAKTAAEAAKKQREEQVKDVEASIEIEKNKADTSRKILEDLYAKKNAIEDKDKKLTAAERQARAEKQKKEIDDALKADQKALDDKAKKRLEATIKLDTELDLSQKENQDKLKSDLDARMKYELDQEGLSEEEKKVIREKYAKEYNDAIKKFQSDNLKTLQEGYKKEEVALQEKYGEDYQKSVQYYADEKKLLTDQKTSLDAALKAGKISQDEYNAAIVANQKAQVANTKASQKNVLDIINETSNAEEQRIQDKYGEMAKYSQEYYDDEKARLDKQQEDLDAALKAGTITQADYNKQKGALSKASQTIDKEETNFHKTQLKEVGNALGELSNLVGKQTAAGKGLAIAQATMNTYQGATEALKQKSTLPSPFDVAAKVINVATVIATGLKSVQSIMSVNVPGAASGGGAAPTGSAKSLGRNYGSGGVIDGPRHAEGGTLINAEGGEAVMTRGAVTMFGPLLSKMNQAGGGTPFMELGGISPVSSVETTQSTLTNPVIKTFVVESDLTTAQHKQARLKNLSTL